MFVTLQGRAVNDGAYIRNMEGHGEIGRAFQQVRFDPGLLRPMFDDDGNRVMEINTGRVTYEKVKDKQGRTRRIPKPITERVRIKDLADEGIVSSMALNATTLSAREWIYTDERVTTVARQRLSAWADLRRVATITIPGMSNMTYEYESMTDPGEAVKDMDAIADARNDAPLFKPRSVPLPITHSDFFFTERRIATSRNKGQAVSTTMAEAAGRRVAEMIEKTYIGTETGITFGTQTAGYGTHDGTSTEYGLTNYPNRTTKTDLTTPLGSNPEAIMTDVLEMIDLLQADNFFGPYVLYHSTGYSRFLNDDYFRTGSTSAVRTVRDRIMDIEGISAIKRLDYLTSGYQLILVQLTSEYLEAINGMEVTTVQWESQGGLRKNWKVMTIQVPVLKADYNGNTPIVHATTS